jgi:membrane-associated protease RseP (regulator of RpoE activity)
MDKVKAKDLVVPGLLLAATFVTTALAGVQWSGQDPTELGNFSAGLPYACLLILVLGSHEMGHYITARLNNVASSLPHFLPFPPHYGLVPFGTLGAVIKIRSQIPSRTALFDIGVSGPIAGFCVSVIVLAVGFATLPPIEFLYSVHPEYRTMESLPTYGLTFGSNLGYEAVKLVFAKEGMFIPPMNEIYHYPFLCVGWFGLFVTALNLIPIGQLDGGHIITAVFPNRARLIGRVTFVILLILGALGLLQLVGGPANLGWLGWGMWAVLLLVFERFAGRREQVLSTEGIPLTTSRLGAFYFSVGCFIFSFCPVPFSL